MNMVDFSTLLGGLSNKCLAETLTVSKGLELGLLALAGILAAYVFSKIPYWFDKKIDRIIALDFDEETKREFSKILRWGVYLTVLYLAFYIVGFTMIHTNPLFQIVVVFFGIKVTIAALKPSVKKIDKKVNDVEIKKGSILTKILTIIVYAVGLFIALSIFGLKGAITTALAGAGVIGLVIGFGAKDLVANTLSGIFIAVDKPFQVNDIIEIKGEVGVVTDMGLRTTEIRKFDNKIVTLPNSYLANNPVVNYSANETRRVSFKVGIDYDSDMEKATEAIKTALSSLESRPEGREPEVLVDEFGDSAIVMKGRVWINQEDYSIIEETSKAKEAVLEELRDKDINVPFPTQVIIKR